MFPKSFTLWMLYVGWAFAQWNGQVKNPEGNPLADVNVYVENSFVGTVTNAQGFFEISPEQEQGVLVFKYLGYQTQKIPFNRVKGESPLSIILAPAPISLNEVEINAQENPAHRIIRAAQAAREENYQRSRNFKADFYSRGIIRTENFPERFLGRELNDLNEVLDSNRNGILYLSESRSKLLVRNQEFKEILTASKVSGNDQGFSFNSAEESEFNFYEPRIEVENLVSSPIGPEAFGIYRFRLENTFYTPEGQFINQILVTPKVPGLGSFQGTVYIVEDDWALYGIDLQYDKSGSPLDQLRVQQIFNFNETAQQWVKSSQVIDFAVGILGFEFNGRFSGVYSNYELDPPFEAQTFDKVVFEVLADANTKDSIFWEKRPIPLTAEEQKDYRQKDRLQQKRESKEYLDSLDQANNRWKWGDVIGKTLQNSHKKTELSYGLGTADSRFNPVSGWQTSIHLNWFKGDNDLPKNWQIRSRVSYGWSDRKWYPTFEFQTRRNRIDYTRYGFQLGRVLKQFDPSPGIDNFRSSFANLFYKENFIRLYQSTFFRANFSRRISPNLSMGYTALVEYRERRVNTTDFSFFHRDETYAANRPYQTNLLQDHEMFVHSLVLNARLGVRLVRYPDRTFYPSDPKYPKLQLRISQGLGGIDDQSFIKYRFRVQQELGLGQYGQSSLALEQGGFIDKNRPAFMDYNHFGGNRTYLIRNGDFAFQMLPHYQFSTTASYLRIHWNHDFGNNTLARLPLIRLLKAEPYFQSNLLAIENRSSYWEGIVGLKNLGLKKFRFLTLAYGQLRYNRQVNHTLLFGIQN